MRKLIIFFIFFAFSLKSHAVEIFIEPYLNYGLGRYDTVDFREQNQTRWFYGVKLGSHIGEMFLFGLDFERSSGKLTSVKNSEDEGIHVTLPKLSVKGHAVGGYVGVQFLLLRTWVSYRFINLKTIEGLEEKEKGHGLKYGLGFTVSPFVSLNLEIENYNPTKESSLKLDSRLYSIGISLPLTL